MLYLDDALKPCFQKGAPLFDQLMALTGECFRDLEGRTTQRVHLNGKYYFIKQHRGIGYREIFKNLFQLRLPVTSAKNEYLAIRKLEQLGVAVPKIAGYGVRGCNPARQESFILMEELAPIKSLEELCATWKQSPPAFGFKLRLLQEAAHITRVMHENGINHRDLYICHLLLEQSATSDVSHQRLFLIDLHRAQIRSTIPARWIIKDLAGLYFSSLDAGLSKRDWFRFMRYYRKQSLHDILQRESQLWIKVKNRGDDLYRDHAK